MARMTLSELRVLIAFACGYCGAGVGELCRRRNGSTTIRVHQLRRERQGEVRSDAAAIFCVYCGSSVEGEWRFCRSCGAELLSGIPVPVTEPNLSVPPQMDRGGNAVQQRVRIRHPRAWEPWSEEEDREALRLHTAGYSISRISRELGRTPCAISSRIEKWALIGSTPSPPTPSQPKGGGVGL